MANAATKIDPIEQSRLLTFTEACQYLGMKKATLYNLVYSKGIPAFKREGSRVWKFDRLDLEAWIQKQKEAHANG